MDEFIFGVSGIGSLGAFGIFYQAGDSSEAGSESYFVHVLGKSALGHSSYCRAACAYPGTRNSGNLEPLPGVPLSEEFCKKNNPKQKKTSCTTNVIAGTNMIIGICSTNVCKKFN